MNEEIEQLKKEVKHLKLVIKELTEALKILSDRDERAKAFIDKVENLLLDVEEVRDEMIAERDA